MPDHPKLTPEQIILIKALQNLTASNLKLIKAVNSLADSVNDMAVIMDSIDPDVPPGTTFN